MKTSKYSKRNPWHTTSESPEGRVTIQWNQEILWHHSTAQEKWAFLRWWRFEEKAAFQRPMTTYLCLIWYFKKIFPKTLPSLKRLTLLWPIFNDKPYTSKGFDSAKPGYWLLCLPLQLVLLIWMQVLPALCASTYTWIKCTRSEFQKVTSF